MKAENIRVGMMLRLKHQRMLDYGMQSPFVTVTALKPHKTYKRIWVVSGTDIYKTSDFARAEGWNMESALFTGPTEQQAAEMKAREQVEIEFAKSIDRTPKCREQELGYCSAWDCPIHGQRNQSV